MLCVMSLYENVIVPCLCILIILELRSVWKCLKLRYLKLRFASLACLQLLEKYKAVDLDEYQRVKTELAAVQV